MNYNCFLLYCHSFKYFRVIKYLHFIICNDYSCTQNIGPMICYNIVDPDGPNGALGAVRVVPAEQGRDCVVLVRY